MRMGLKESDIYGCGCGCGLKRQESKGADVAHNCRIIHHVGVITGNVIVIKLLFIDGTR